MLLLSGSQAAERERYAWRLLCLLDSCPLPRSQLRQKPRSCVQALHGMRSLWWVLDGLINPLFILSFPLPLMFSSAFFSAAPAFPYVFPLPPLPSYPHPLLNLWTREAELISCQAAASGYCVHCHRVKGVLGFWVCHYSTAARALFCFTPYSALVG